MSTSDKPVGLAQVEEKTSLPESKLSTYKANYHWQAVKLEVTLEELFPQYKVNKCNCSICTQNGYLLVYPARQDVKWLQGYDNLAEYYFHRKKVAHKFCKTCGSSILIGFQRSKWYGGTDPEKDELTINKY